MSFILYTPPGYQEGTRIPAILAAYPLDYADQSVAGQVTGSQQRFTRLDDYRLLLLAGYALIDNASFPIIGDPKKAYDHYIDQLVEDANAAVAKAVETGVVDPQRIGVTGHSHGALMTVNLLAHSDLFRAMPPAPTTRRSRRSAFKASAARCGARKTSICRRRRSSSPTR